ncbi:MAG: acyl-CoA dehydrogenase [Bacteroidetes bacterium]|nr:acyl-CoA dehydrogenase [Bacteroidota bacterium]
MSNTPLGNAFARLNKALDGRVAKAIGLRKVLERATYSSIYNGVKISRKASSVLPKGKGSQKDPARLEKAASKGLFDLNYTEEQQMIREAIGDFVAQKIKPAAEHCSEEGKVSDEINNGFNELGLSFYAIPESMGGIQSEQSTVTQMAIAESLAYGDVGIALALMTPLSALNALVRWGSAAQQEQYITPFLEENNSVVASIAVDEPEVLFDPNKLSCKAVKSGSGYRLSGVKSMIPLAGKASFFLVAADLEGDGPSVFIIDADDKGINLVTDRGMGIRAAETGKLELKDASGQLLVSGDSYGDFINLAKLGWCSLAVGACQAALEYVIEYCNAREAFGEPITHRQAVAFMIANIKIELESMRVLTQRAVSRAEQGLDFGKEAYLASVMCNEKSMAIANDAVQLLGGYGFCRDYPVERWYRDLRAVSISYNGMHL